MSNKMKRREFLKAGAALGGYLTLGTGIALGAEPDGFTVRPGTLPKRRYGKTETMLSVIGFAGFCLREMEQKHANRLVAQSVARGVNYFDVAPDYDDSEIKLGPALEPYRKDVFLACKTHARDRETAEFEFARSLECLRTDHFDLFQLHGITSVDKDVDTSFAKGGVMEMIREKKKAGQIRYVGFSAHSVEAALAAFDRYPFDSALFPVNFACFEKGDFGPQILKRAQKTGAAVLAIKPMAKQRWARDDSRREEWWKCWYEPLIGREEAAMGLRWTLSQPVTAAVPPADPRLYRMGLDIALESIEPRPGDAEKLTAMAQSLRPVFSIT